MIKNFEKIIHYSMAFIEDDYTELWVIVNKILSENPELEFNELIEATKIVLKELVEVHDVRLLDENSQMPADLDCNKILNIAERLLHDINRIPNIGDGIWFTI